MYQAAQNRYNTLPTRRCGNSGLLLPAVSLGLWHNFGDTSPYENMRALCRTAFDNGSRFVCYPAGWLRQRRFFLCQCFFGSCQQHSF